MIRPLQENKKYGVGGCNNMVLEKKNFRRGLREKERGGRSSYVFQSLRTERAAVSMSGIPPVVEAM